MNNETYEREIDLKDLLFHILYRWRSIIIAGCILSLLLGGYKVVWSQRITADGSGEQERYQKQLELYELAVSEYELNQTVYNRNIEIYEIWLKQQNTYMEKSVLMHTDPFNKPVATANFFVKLEDSEWDRLPNNDNLSLDPTNSVIQAYAANFYSIIDWEPLEKLTGIESLYLRELIGASADYNSDMITITVVYSDGDTAQEILEEVTGQMLNRRTVADKVAAHKITLINQSLVYMIDNSLANSQKSNADTVDTYEQYILDNRNELSELKEPIKPEAVTTAVFKYFVIGAFLGAFLLAGCYCVGYLFSNAVRTDRELKERYGFQLLGAFAKPDRKGIFSFIDQWIERMEGIRVKTSQEVVCHCIAANIMNFARDKKNLLLTGTVSAEELDALAKKVAPDLKDIRLQVMDNMNRNPETIRHLSQCDGVILVEKRNVSRYDEIQVEQEMTRALEIPVVGYIML